MSNQSSQQYASTHILRAKDWALSFGLILGSLFFSVVFGIGLVLATEGQVLLLGSVAASGFASAMMFGLHASTRSDPAGYIDVPGISGKAIGIGILFGGVLIVVQTAMTALFVSRGIGDPVGPLGRLVQQNGWAVLVGLVLINIVLVAPAEELLYRNGVQKILQTNHSKTVAVVGSGIIFTLPHIPSGVSPDTIETLTSLLGIFVNGIGYGIVYVRWNRVDITMIGHAMYNIAVLLFAYFHVF